MTIVNLLAQIASTEYPKLYMVWTPEMEEARRRGGVFGGTVGRLVPELAENNDGLQVFEVKTNPVGENQAVQVIEREPQSNYDTYAPLATSDVDLPGTLEIA